MTSSAATGLLVILLIPVLAWGQSSATLMQEGPPSAKAVVAGVLHRPALTVYRAGKLVDQVSWGSPEEEVQVLVQFRSAPLAQLRLSGRPAVAQKAPASASLQAAARATLEAEHQAFPADLARLEAGQGPSTFSVRPPVRAARITAEFRHAFNGVALTCRRALLSSLGTLSYVKRLELDRDVRALDDQSNHAVGADSAQARYGLTGKAVRIGVFDTGIDYTHPDLGGGFGPGYKVRGGYDFVNKTLDPKDDNGHGTHVAGLIAAKGATFQGVAPDALLWSYKVLNSSGVGSLSNVLAALDQALADSLQIVNISLGASGGDPGDFLSQAVDNATASGLLVVAAVGNQDSWDYYTLPTPACAAGALTVAVTNNNDYLYFIGCRGPATSTYAIKPDLAAPGVNVSSTWVGGTYSVQTGSSVSAPQASGAAALLLEAHRDWRPELVKASLMAAGRYLGSDLWTEGMGAMNVFQALKETTVAVPAAASFGLVDAGQSLWVKHDTLTLYNLSDSAKSYTLTLPDLLPVGVSASVTPSGAFPVPAHQGQAVVLTVSVDNSVAQIPSAGHGGTQGRLLAVSGTDTLRIPFAFVQGSFIDVEAQASGGWMPLTIYFTRADGALIRYDSQGIPQPSYSVKRIITPATYDIVAVFGYPAAKLSWVVRDSVVVKPTATIYLNQATDAPYQVGADLTDEAGGPLDPLLYFNGAAHLYSKRTGLLFGANNYFTHAIAEYQRLGGAGGTSYLSPLTSTYTYDYFAFTDPSLPKIYSWATQVTGLTSDHIVRFTPGAVQKRIINWRDHTGLVRHQMTQSLDFSSGYLEGGLGDMTFQDFPLEQVWYSTGLPPSGFPASGHLLCFADLYVAGMKPVGQYYDIPLSYTPNQYLRQDGILCTSVLGSTMPLLQTRATTILYGLGPRHFFGTMRNSTQEVRLESPVEYPRYAPDDGSKAPYAEPTSGLHFPLFVNQWLDAPLAGFPFRLQDESGTILAGGSTASVLQDGFTDSVYCRWASLALPGAGGYSLTLVDTASWILGRKGRATATLNFDSRKGDKNPPHLLTFNVLADSEFADCVAAGQKGEVSVWLSDDGGPLSSTTLRYQIVSDTLWRNLSLSTIDGEHFQALLPQDLPEGYVSLRLLAEDLAGNTLDYRAEPAFFNGTYVNHAPSAPVLLEPADSTFVQQYNPPKPLVFRWGSAHDPDFPRDTVRYTFYLYCGGGDTTITGLSDTVLVLPDITRRVYISGGTSQWLIRASDGLATTQSTTVGSFRVSENVLAVDLPQTEGLPKVFALLQNYPNPFNPTTTIRYELPKETKVSLKLYNILGQEVRTLVSGVQHSGRYAVELNAHSLASGIYIYRLESGTFVQSRTLCLIK